MEINYKHGIIDNVLIELGEEPLTTKESNTVMQYVREEEHSNVFLEKVITFHTGAFLQYIYEIIGRELPVHIYNEQSNEIYP